MFNEHKLLAFTFVLILFPFFRKTVYAQAVINEFSVDPPDKYDWIELYSPDVLDISGWKIADEAGDFFTVPDGTILGSGAYYVLSKYQRLNNDKDTIYLKDKSENTIDSVKYGYDGEVCLPGTDGSIARVPDGGNTIDRLLIHTQGSTNGEQITDICPTPTPIFTATPTSTVVSTNTPTPTSTTTPLSTPTKTPTPKPTLVPRGTPESVLSDAETSETFVLGIEDEFDKKEASESQEDKNGSSMLPFLFIVAGLICIGTASFLVFGKSKAYNEKSEESN